MKHTLSLESYATQTYARTAPESGFFTVNLDSSPTIIPVNLPRLETLARKRAAMAKAREALAVIRSRRKLAEHDRGIAAEVAAEDAARTAKRRPKPKARLDLAKARDQFQTVHAAAVEARKEARSLESAARKAREIADRRMPTGRTRIGRSILHTRPAKSQARRQWNLKCTRRRRILTQGPRLSRPSAHGASRSLDRT